MKVWTRRFIVRSDTRPQFPLYMLRVEHCWPADPSAELIIRASFDLPEDHAGDMTLRVELVKVCSSPDQEPHRELWRSRGWLVELVSPVNP